MSADQYILRRAWGKSTTLADRRMLKPGERVLSWHEAVQAATPEVRVKVLSRPSFPAVPKPGPSPAGEVRRDAFERVGRAIERIDQRAHGHRSPLFGEILGVLAAIALAVAFLTLLFLCGR